MHGQIEQLISERRFAELVCIFRKLWDKQGGLYLKRNKNAVERIKQKFTELTGNQPYTNASAAARWDEQIAKYLDRLGVAPLIDDMTDAVRIARMNRRALPKSILYFIYSKTGACRWENLLMQDVLDRIAVQKKEYEEIDSAIEALLKNSIEPVEPEWVVAARGHHKILIREMQHPRTTGDRRRQISTQAFEIRKRLESFGFSLYDQELK